VGTVLEWFRRINKGTGNNYSVIEKDDNQRVPGKIFAEKKYERGSQEQHEKDGGKRTA